MNCYLHPETSAVAYCRSCGRPLCAVCQQTVDGVVYCQDHVPIPVFAASVAGATSGASAAGGSGAANPYVQPLPAVAPEVMSNSPVLAFILGFIPGVGAIYNGQYVKGLVHAVIFGLIISLMNDAEGVAEPFLAFSLVAFIFYMAFEAYHTARRRQMRLPVDEWSGLASSGGRWSRAPVGPIVLIGIGILFLLDTLHLVEFREIARFWPVLLILVGILMLVSRLGEIRSAPHRRHSDEPLGAAHE